VEFRMDNKGTLVSWDCRFCVHYLYLLFFVNFDSSGRLSVLKGCGFLKGFVRM
jgi:hypothetical protein